MENSVKAIESCECYRAFAEKVKAQEHFKHRPGHSKTTKTWRYKLACGMLQVYDQIEHKRLLRAKWDAEQEKEDVVERAEVQGPKVLPWLFV